MKLHRNLVDAVVDGLLLIFNENQYADKVVEKLLKRDARWGARDRGFVAETVYDIVRWKRLYSEIAEVGEHYNVQNLRRVFAVWAVLRGYNLPEWYFAHTPTRRIKGRFDELSKERKFRESLPNWLDELGVAELGEAFWEQEIAALNTPAPVVLRANRLKITPTELQKQLLAEQVATSFLGEKYPDALALQQRSNVFQTQSFTQGFFEVQDASSQRVGAFMQVESAMRVADCCAGAGGKTLHLAALMQNKGHLLSMDIYPNKLYELKRRARRAGAFNIETKLVDNQFIKRIKGSFDRVLIDAPCSGLGVLRRNPDAKWKLQPEFLTEIKATQRQILTQYSNLTKVGGKLVYATCSILPSENENQVKHFLESEQGKGFKLEKQEKIFASQSGFDGFYMARLVKEC